VRDVGDPCILLPPLLPGDDSFNALLPSISQCTKLLK
jgi:hypothetical protein